MSHPLLSLRSQIGCCIAAGDSASRSTSPPLQVVADMVALAELYNIQTSEGPVGKLPVPRISGSRGADHQRFFAQHSSSEPATFSILALASAVRCEA